MDRQTFERNNVKFHEWLQHGITHRYFKEVCIAHNDRSLWTQHDHEAFDAGEDPCVIKLVVDDDLA